MYPIQKTEIVPHLNKSSCRDEELSKFDRICMTYNLKFFKPIINHYYILVGEKLNLLIYFLVKNFSLRNFVSEIFLFPSNVKMMSLSPRFSIKYTRPWKVESKDFILTRIYIIYIIYLWQDNVSSARTSFQAFKFFLQECIFSRIGLICLLPSFLQPGTKFFRVQISDIYRD